MYNWIPEKTERRIFTVSWRKKIEIIEKRYAREHNVLFITAFANENSVKVISFWGAISREIIANRSKFQLELD